MRIVLSILLLAANAFAGTFFVNAASTGTHNGTSYTNAWLDMNNISWGSVTAGSTICIAGGTYTGTFTTGANGSSGNPITIKRAVASDSLCGSTAAGWNAAYDSQVVLAPGWTINNTFITIDGMVANGITTALTAGVCTGFLQDCVGIDIGNASPGASNITIRNVESSGPCGATNCTYQGIGHNIRIGHWLNAGSWQPVPNILLQYLNLHGGCDNMQVEGATGTIEYSRFADTTTNGQTGANMCHPNVIEGGEGGVTLTYRYNEWVNWQVEGIMMCPSSPGCGAENWEIYGNIFHDASTASFPRFLAFQNSATGTVHVYNNSFINAGTFGCYSAEGGTPSGAADNNIYFGSGFHSCGFPFTEDYAASDGTTGQAHGQNNLTSAIFVNASAHTVAGYSLSGHTSAGLNVGSPYNIDYNGNTRTTWDRGFVEFGSGTVTPPAPASSLFAFILWPQE